MTPQRIRGTVRRFALEHELLRPGALVVAASGGTDSTALVLILGDLAAELGLVLHVAHFDHRIRRSGAADAQLVSELAARVGATVRIGRAEHVPKSEDEARRARYEFLRRVASDRRATAVATGHTRDDQAETVLLHVTRGSGLAGLAGMRPSRAGIVRPLLAIGRAETAEVCRAAGVAPREDPSNRSLRFARNRIRRRVLPELAAINPRIASALARLADAAADVTAAHRARALAALDAATLDGAIALSGLGDNAAVREEALSLAWDRATGRVLTERQRDALAALAERRDGTASLDLPGGRARREYGTLRIDLRAEAASAATGGADRAVPLPLGGAVYRDGWRIELRTGDPGAAPLSTTVPRGEADGLAVRPRRPGDRMAGPLRRKVQDVLTDAKVPVRERARIPLVVTRDGAVAWVPGVVSAWNGLSEGCVLVAHAPAAWQVPEHPRRRGG